MHSEVCAKTPPADCSVPPVASLGAAALTAITAARRSACVSTNIISTNARENGANRAEVSTLIVSVWIPCAGEKYDPRTQQPSPVITRIEKRSDCRDDKQSNACSQPPFGREPRAERFKFFISHYHSPCLISHKANNSLNRITLAGETGARPAAIAWAAADRFINPAVIS